MFIGSRLLLSFWAWAVRSCCRLIGKTATLFFWRCSAHSISLSIVWSIMVSNPIPWWLELPTHKVCCIATNSVSYYVWPSRLIPDYNVVVQLKVHRSNQPIFSKSTVGLLCVSKKCEGSSQKDIELAKAGWNRTWAVSVEILGLWELWYLLERAYMCSRILWKSATGCSLLESATIHSSIFSYYPH